jgi:anti-sigma factor RsiW
VVSGHVESLFSAAYDGELSPDARAAFDRHLGECSACAAAFAELTTAVDALREQPSARMPHPVRLPEGSPVPEGRWFGVPGWLPQGRRLLTGLTAAGLVAAAAVATVVVVGHLNSGAVVPSSSSAGMSSGVALAPAHVPAFEVAPSGNAATGVCAAAGCPTLTPSTACPSQLQGTDAASASQIPDGFNNRVSQNDGFTEVILATPSLDYTPGETVDVYARLVDVSTDAVYLPCTFLVGPTVGGSATVAAAPATTTYATPIGTLTVDGQPVLEVVIPSTEAAGQNCQIVAEVPAGAGEAQASEVTLKIQVT